MNNLILQHQAPTPKALYSYHLTLKTEQWIPRHINKKND